MYTNTFIQYTFACMFKYNKTMRPLAILLFYFVIFSLFSGFFCCRSSTPFHIRHTNTTAAIITVSIHDERNDYSMCASM